MGIDASYVFEYTPGLLKNILSSVKRQQHYHGKDIMMFRSKHRGRYGDSDDEESLYTASDLSDDESDPILGYRMFVFGLSHGSKGKYHSSTITYIPDFGLLEVNDVLRYYGNDKKHNRACDYYESLGAKNSTIMPDYMKPTQYGFRGHIINGINALGEIPVELLTEEERKVVTALFGAKGNENDQSVEAAVHNGDAAIVKAYLEVCDTEIKPKEWKRLLWLSLEARSTSCVRMLMDSYPVYLSQCNHELMRIAIRNKDTPTLLALAEYSVPITSKQLYDCALLMPENTFYKLLDTYYTPKDNK